MCYTLTGLAKKKGWGGAAWLLRDVTSFVMAARFSMGMSDRTPLMLMGAG